MAIGAIPPGEPVKPRSPRHAAPRAAKRAKHAAPEPQPPVPVAHDAAWVGGWPDRPPVPPAGYGVAGPPPPAPPAPKTGHRYPLRRPIPAPPAPGCGAPTPQAPVDSATIGIGPVRTNPPFPMSEHERAIVRYALEAAASELARQGHAVAAGLVEARAHSIPGTRP